MTNPWTWSQAHHDYYYVTYDAYNRPIYHWFRQSQAVVHPGPRHDSGTDQTIASNTVRMPDPVPQEVRVLKNFIAGTPETGWYDQLDNSYVMRTGQDASRFFVIGRVFAMLYIENAAETSSQNANEAAYTVVRFGGVAYSTIRRFVVVAVKRGFVQACGIGTYSGRGTLKYGCVPSEHAIVYCTGVQPASCYIPGEWESGMKKDPIEVIPADANTALRPESRIRFGKTYPIEMNVKVKDIGQVHPEHRSKLLQYWIDEGAS
ncbi:hypothetical protein J1614_011141 [Plenodomus biglobosus]|nr:hypothetical protein J1614_011141 [Plenodomus biglobosus]